MTTKSQPNQSFASQLGYRAGDAVRSARLKVYAFEAQVGHKAEVGGVPFGRKVVTSVFWLLKIGLAVSVIAMSLWAAFVILGLIAIFFTLAAMSARDGLVRSEDSGPDYLGADTYLGNYDDNGHWIGHFKSDHNPPK